jgi:hypothetical protein
VPELAQTNKGALTSALRTGLRKIDADVDRMQAALSTPGFTVSRGAFQGLDAARAHATELRNKIAGDGFAHPARARAVAGLDSLIAGLQQLRRRWLGYNNVVLIADGDVRPLPLDGEIDRLLIRARDLLGSADELLGCPFGCPERPQAPTFGSTP